MKRKHLVYSLLVIVLIITGCTDKKISNNENNIKVYKELENGEYKDDYSIKDTIALLSSNQLEGRLPGTEGNNKAIEFIVNRFKTIGLEPFENNDYFHKYYQKIYNPKEGTHKVEVEFDNGNKKEYDFGKEYIEYLRPSNVEVESYITFDINDKDLSNKILVIDEKEYDYKLRDLSKGLLVRKESFSGYVQVNEYNKKPFLQITDKTYNELKSKKASKIKIVLNHSLKDSLLENIVGKISGNDSSNALVISAHFDHVGWNDEVVFNGAIDNASGTTVLLDLAKRLKIKSEDKKFDMDIIFVAFNGEESGLLGSKAFVSDIKGKYENIYNLNVDCVGKKDGGVIALGNDYNELNKELLEEIKIELNEHNIDFIEDYYGLSDHNSFNEVGYQGITIGENNLIGKDLPFTVHSNKDNIDVIDFKFLGKVSDLIYDFVIKNDGKIFKSDETSVKNETVDNTYDKDEMDEVFKKLDKIVSEKNLQYDEKYTTEIDGYQCVMAGRKLLNKDDIKKYYPSMNIIEEINGYTFDYGIVMLGEGGTTVYAKGDKVFSDEELDKVTKLDVSIDKVRYVSLYYKKDKDKIYINIEKQDKYSNDDFIFRVYNTEKIDINGEDYYLLSNKDNDKLTGIYKLVKVNKNTYNVRFISNKNDFNDEITREDIINTLKKFDLNKIIKELKI